MFFGHVIWLICGSQRLGKLLTMFQNFKNIGILHVNNFQYHIKEEEEGKRKRKRTIDEDYIVVT